jgi:hypothetical protein
VWALCGAAVLGAVVLFATGLDSSVLRLVDDNSLSGSNDYRRLLIERALRGEGLSWFGETHSALGAGIVDGSASVDNAYLAIAADWGYVGLIGFAGVAAGVAISAWRLRGSAWALIPAVALANYAGLFEVAINTQTQYWLWMLVGGCAGALSLLSAPERSRRAARQVAGR